LEDYVERSRDDDRKLCNKSLRSRLGESIDWLRSAAFEKCQKKRKITEKPASLRKVRLLFLLDVSLG
jgi:hypothetical protein